MRDCIAIARLNAPAQQPTKFGANSASGRNRPRCVRKHPDVVSTAPRLVLATQIWPKQRNGCGDHPENWRTPAHPDVCPKTHLSVKPARTWSISPRVWPKTTMILIEMYQPCQKSRHTWSTHCADVVDTMQNLVDGAQIFVEVALTLVDMAQFGPKPRQNWSKCVQIGSNPPRFGRSDTKPRRTLAGLWRKLVFGGKEKQANARRHRPKYGFNHTFCRNSEKVIETTSNSADTTPLDVFENKKTPRFVEPMPDSGTTSAKSVAEPPHRSERSGLERLKHRNDWTNAQSPGLGQIWPRLGQITARSADFDQISAELCLTFGQLWMMSTEAGSKCDISFADFGQPWANLADVCRNVARNRPSLVQGSAFVGRNRCNRAISETIVETRSSPDWHQAPRAMSMMQHIFSHGRPHPSSREKASWRARVPASHS